MGGRDSGRRDPSTAVWSPEGWTEHRLSPIVSRHSVPSCGWRIDGALSSLVVSGDTASPGGQRATRSRPSRSRSHVPRGGADRAEAPPQHGSRSRPCGAPSGCPRACADPLQRPFVRRHPLFVRGQCCLGGGRAVRGLERRGPADRPNRRDGSPPLTGKVGWEARLLVEGRR